MGTVSNDQDLKDFLNNYKVFKEGSTSSCINLYMGDWFIIKDTNTGLEGTCTLIHKSLNSKLFFSIYTNSHPSIRDYTTVSGYSLLHDNFNETAMFKDIIYVSDLLENYNSIYSSTGVYGFANVIRYGYNNRISLYNPNLKGNQEWGTNPYRREDNKLFRVVPFSMSHFGFKHYGSNNSPDAYLNSNFVVYDTMGYFRFAGNKSSILTASIGCIESTVSRYMTAHDYFSREESYFTSKNRYWFCIDTDTI